MRFRFTTRDLLWLAAVVALAVSLVLEHQKRSQAESVIGVYRFRNAAFLKKLNRLHPEFFAGCGGIWPEEEESFANDLSPEND